MVFKYTDYRLYIIEKLNELGAKSGSKSALAAAIECQPGFISHVISGKAHLSLEQAQRANAFFRHSEEASNYFILIVSYSRAGTNELRNYFLKQIEKILQKEVSVEKSVSAKVNSATEFSSEYYSNIYYQIVHMMLTIKPMSIQSLADALKQDTELISSICKKLQDFGLVESVRDQFYVKNDIVIHLPKDSPFITTHHTNFKILAIESIRKREKSDLHYSSLVTLSREDVRIIKNLILEMNKQSVDKISKSKPECMYGYSFDFFKII
ncbi:MAG: TIGR02147 family protein [Bdellovibrionota bacterium]